MHRFTGFQLLGRLPVLLAALPLMVALAACGDPYSGQGQQGELRSTPPPPWQVPARLVPVLLGEQEVGVTARFYDTLVVRVLDASGAPFPSKYDAQWSVLRGSAVIAGTAPRSGGSDRAGSAYVVPPGRSDTSIVRAAIPQYGINTTFRLIVTPGRYDVQLRVLPREPFVEFASRQNLSVPAVDTVPVGATVWWRLWPFDQRAHEIVPVGPATFESAAFSDGFGAYPETSVTFTAPGTYAYSDRQHPGVVGTLVVR